MNLAKLRFLLEAHQNVLAKASGSAATKRSHLWGRPGRNSISS